MTEVRTQLPRSVVEGALGIPKPAESLGKAACLYLALLSAATNRGIVIRTRKRLAEMIAASESDIDAWIVRLMKLGLLTIEVPSPYLVMRLRFWPSDRSSGEQNPEQSGRASGEKQIDVPVSGKQAAAAISKTNGDGVQGEGAAVLAEAQKTLGGSDAEEVTELLTQYPQAIVRRALARVRATPERRIRKSKIALFRFLLAKFTDDAHGKSPDHHSHT